MGVMNKFKRQAKLGGWRKIHSFFKDNSRNDINQYIEKEFLKRETGMLQSSYFNYLYAIETKMGKKKFALGGKEAQKR